MGRIVCQAVDYTDTAQGHLLVRLLDGFAQDPMGLGDALTDTVRQTLPSKLAQISPQAFSFIAYYWGEDDEQQHEPAGLVNCFQGFSTFAAAPLVNIHDVYVVPEHRGKGVSQSLLQAVEREARKRSCCKITLEVLSKNETAMRAYRKSGFASFELDPEHGVAMFMEKKLKNAERA